MLDLPAIVLVLDLFVILFIGMGPVKALVPFLSHTAGRPPAEQAAMARRMVLTAAGTALVLILIGRVIVDLLKISTEALAIAGGIIFLLLALEQVMGSKDEESGPVTAKDPASIAIYPLAIPVLLNPIGIVALVVISGETTTLAQNAVVIVVMLAVTLINLLVFSNVQRFASRMNPATSLVGEKVFGIFLAALAIQIILSALASLGVIGPLPG